MSVRSALTTMLARFYDRRRPAPTTPERGSEDTVADDPTVLVAPSQAVTVSIERPQANDPSRSRSRKPLPWPARDTNRQQRRSVTDDTGPQASSPSTGGPDLGDVTVVIAPAAKDEPQADLDATVVRRAGDTAGRPLP